MLEYGPAESAQWLRTVVEAPWEGFPVLLRRRVLDGLPYVGRSAGSVIVGPSIEPASGLEGPAPG